MPILNFQGTDFETNPAQVAPSFGQQDQDKSNAVGLISLTYQSMQTENMKPKALRWRESVTPPVISGQEIKLKGLVFPAFEPEAGTRTPLTDFLNTYADPAFIGLINDWNRDIVANVDINTVLLNFHQLQPWLQRVKEATDNLVAMFRTRPRMMTYIRTDHPIHRHGYLAKEGSGVLHRYDLDVKDEKKVESMPNSLRYPFGCVSLVLSGTFGVPPVRTTEYVKMVKARGYNEADALSPEKVEAMIWRLMRTGCKDVRNAGVAAIQHAFHFDIPLCLLSQLFVLHATRMNYPTDDMITCAMSLNVQKLSDVIWDQNWDFMTKFGESHPYGSLEKSGIFFHPNHDVAHLDMPIPVVNTVAGVGPLLIAEECTCYGSILKNGEITLGRRGHLLDDAPDKTRGLVLSAPVVRMMTLTRSMYNPALNANIYNCQDELGTGYTPGILGDLVGVPLIKGVFIPCQF